MGDGQCRNRTEIPKMAAGDGRRAWESRPTHYLTLVTSHHGFFSLQARSLSRIKAWHVYDPRCATTFVKRARASPATWAAGAWGNRPAENGWMNPDSSARPFPAFRPRSRPREKNGRLSRTYPNPWAGLHPFAIPAPLPESAGRKR